MKIASVFIVTNLLTIGLVDSASAFLMTQTVQNQSGVTVNDLHLTFKKSVGGSTANGQAGKPKNPNNGTSLIWDYDFPDLDKKDKVMIKYDTPCDKCGIDPNGNNYWTQNGEEVEGGGVKLVGLANFVVPNQQAIPLSVKLFNESSTSITYNNIQVFEDNNISNYNLDNFLNPTGNLVSNIPTVITLAPGETFDVSLDNIVQNPSTYLLFKASAYSDNDSSNTFDVATAYDFTQPECIPEPSLGLGLLSLGVLSLGKFLKRSQKRVE